MVLDQIRLLVIGVVPQVDFKLKCFKCRPKPFGNPFNGELCQGRVGKFAGSTIICEHEHTPSV